MSDLIWVGNTLVQRGLVIMAAAIILIVVAAALAWVTLALSSNNSQGEN